MYDDDEDSGSDQRLGAVMYSVMFAAYLLTLAILALCGVSYIYFFAVLLAGFPVSGVYLSMVQGIQMRKQTLADVTPEPHYRTKNDAGLDVIEL